MQTLLANTHLPLPVVLEIFAAPAGLLEQNDADTQTTEKAIHTALSVAGIKSPELKALGFEALKAELPLLLHLAAEIFLLRRDEPDLPFYEALRYAIDAREAQTRFWKAHNQACDMVGVFQDWLDEEHARLTSQVDLLQDEISNIAPLAKRAREQNGGAELVAYYNSRCALLWEAREALALIEANDDLRHFDMMELSNSAPGALLLWERFCGE